MEERIFKSDKTGFLGRVFNISVAVLGIVGTILGIYTGFFYERKPNISLEVLSNAAVLDVRENVSKLDIIYGGRNLNANNLALSILTLKIVNNGQGDMLLTHYDDNDLLGFALLNASLAEPPVILAASNNYLGTRIRIDMKSPQLVTFSPVIVEAKEFFVVKLLALHTKGIVPVVEPVGKVAGVTTKIEVTEPFREEQNETFLQRTFQGSVWVQVARGVAYFLASLVVIVSTVFIVVTWDERSSKNNRKRIVEEFRSTNKSNIEPALIKVFEKYIESGDFYLYQIQKLVGSNSTLKKYSETPSIGVSKRMAHERDFLNQMVTELADLGLIQTTGNQMAFNPSARKILREFFKFVSKDIE